MALVDKNVDKHGVRKEATAFLNYLWTPEAQAVFAQYGYRPVDPTVAAANASQFPTPKDLFTISYFGGWSKVSQPMFGTTGTITSLMNQVYTGKK